MGWGMGDVGWSAVNPALRIKTGQGVGLIWWGSGLTCHFVVLVGWRGILRLFRTASRYLVLKWWESKKVFGGRLPNLGDGTFGFG